MVADELDRYALNITYLHREGAAMGGSQAALLYFAACRLGREEIKIRIAWMCATHVSAAEGEGHVKQMGPLFCHFRNCALIVILLKSRLQWWYFLE
jgi:hypothetical protein